MNYRHSEVFAALKATNEGIKTNLTTGQYLKTLDQYLLNATMPVLEATCYFDVIISKLAAWSTENFRRKLSMKNLDFPSLAIKFLMQDTPDGKAQVWKDMSLDRAVIFTSLHNFLTSLRDYEMACNCEGPVPLAYTSCPEVYYLHIVNQHELSLEARRPLLPVIQQVRYWLSEALEFKKRILEKYTRFCLNIAQKDYVHHFQCRQNLNDMVQSYLIAADRAIDKCDASQGALTPHIQNWLLTARNHLTKSQQIENKEVPLETLDTNEGAMNQLNSLLDDVATSVENIEHVRRIARLADLKGTGRILLGIEESLPLATRSYLHTLAATTYTPTTQKG
jgi:hypothetical protein